MFFVIQRIRVYVMWVKYMYSILLLTISYTFISKISKLTFGTLLSVLHIYNITILQYYNITILQSFTRGNAILQYYSNANFLRITILQ